LAGAAFFDLDRTLLRRSSALALAGSFRERGFISRTQVVKAAGWQLLFMLRGASHEAVRRASEDGLLVLRGHSPDEVRDLVAGAMETVLRPLVYGEPLHLVEEHRARGEKV
jgi:phosphoserine phosphatase